MQFFRIGSAMNEEAKAYRDETGCSVEQAIAIVKGRRTEERTLVRIAKLSGLRLSASGKGEHTLAALIGVLLDAEVNS
jgi:hypothetical protein